VPRRRGELLALALPTGKAAPRREQAPRFRAALRRRRTAAADGRDTRRERTWRARLTNAAGLIAGLTTLGDELHLLYGNAEIVASAFATRLSRVWDGTTFVAP
jgi:hypothetical protein